MLEKNAVLFAHKALTLVGELSVADRRVAGAIIDHFNKRTGQCDPGNERLAELLGLDARTVRRATSDLCSVYGLFSKVSHGGKSHRAAYTPNWKKLTAIVEDWDCRMRARREPINTDDHRANPPASTGRLRPAQPGEIALQTLRSNLSHKLTAPSSTWGDVTCDGRHVLSDRCRDLQLEEGGRRSWEHAKEVSGRWKARDGTCHGMAARAQAERRLDADLRRLGWQAHAYAIEYMDDVMVEAAALAEMRRHGGGLQLVIDQLGPRILHGTRTVGDRS